jgi:hypothetical protein
MHPAALPAATLFEECDETRTRRSGPGGQHRNKVETAVILVHRPTGLAAEGSERRSQAENPTGPSPLWRSRASGGRLVVAIDHHDYPALVAEALDRLDAAGWNLPPAAAALGITPSQLARLLRREPAAWTLLAHKRAAVGLRPLA